MFWERRVSGLKHSKLAPKRRLKFRSPEGWRQVTSPIRTTGTRHFPACAEDPKTPRDNGSFNWLVRASGYPSGRGKALGDSARLSTKEWVNDAVVSNSGTNVSPAGNSHEKRVAGQNSANTPARPGSKDLSRRRNTER